MHFGRGGGWLKNVPWLSEQNKGAQHSLSPCYLVVGRWLCCDHGKAVGIKGPKLDFCPSAAWRGARKFCTLTARGNFAMDVLKRCFVRQRPATAYFHSGLLSYSHGGRVTHSIALLYYTTTEKRLSRVTFVSVPIQKWPLQHIFVLVSRGIWKKKILKKNLYCPKFFSWNAGWET